ncbi:MULTISPECIES: hypothetical protein [Pseudoalteromonas]|uniref:Uncharacterized protein n=1 Tax=Pseudoalteromonas aurantia 208 TaxID=1314867 RepID=A0ABR9ELM1_9GAMM|nr:MULTISPECIES: hypothetical protein [Pseudoalteromonas]MBE0370623.1 hypothetical protein [Pseudoalteromonas aurantia 208]MBQ4845203.1 hypothetical protein [Pseudoalteromonas sp. MMG005]
MKWFSLFSRKSRETSANTQLCTTLPRYTYFNATGHILFSTHHDPRKPLPSTVQLQFFKAVSLFSAMMKTLSTTPNPATGKPYSAFNYHALSTLINKTGYFVQTSNIELTINHQDLRQNNHPKLFETLLGINVSGQELAFAPAIIHSIEKETLRMSKAEQKKDFKSAYLVFVCECIGGMPLISIQLFSFDSIKQSDVLKQKTCSTKTSKDLAWTLNKESYLYLPDQVM